MSNHYVNQEGLEGATCPICSAKGFHNCKPKDGSCHICGDDDFSPNIEAFEICGQLTCDECAEEILEANSQFGIGA